jgi:phenylacetate-CoA ligase
MHPRLILSRRLRRHHDAAEQRRLRPPPDPATVPGLQLAALREVWADAVADVPYYADLVAAGDAPKQLRSWQDVAAIPVLTRQAFQDRPAAFVRRSGPADSVMKTAGSTGTPIHLGMNQSERDLMRIVKLSAWQELGYRPDSRLFIMWGHIHLLGTDVSRVINTARRSIADRLLGYRRVNAYRLSPEICHLFAEQLIAHHPVGFISYASALDLFGRYTTEYRDRFRALGLRFVLSTSEPPPRPDTVPMLEDLFGCPVVQEYGGGEFGQVAFKNGAAPFEVYSDLNYVECEAPDPDLPSACPLLVTSLYPRYVPLIRYRVGDAVAAPERLAHGHTLRFASVAGRLNDVIHLADGEAIHSVAVFHCIHAEPSVFNIQMVLRNDRIDLRLVAPGADRPALEARIRSRLSKVHPALAQAQFDYVDDVGTTRAGKRRWFLDERTPESCAASPAS